MHRAKSLGELFTEDDGTLRQFDLPAECPDVVLIEYLWDYLEEQVKHQQASQTLADLPRVSGKVS